MESRHSMVIGGAAVAVITLAVASAVTITNAAALSDSSGQALAESTITLSAGGAASPKAVVSTPSRARVSPDSSSGTAELVPAPEAAPVSAPRSRTASSMTRVAPSAARTSSSAKLGQGPAGSTMPGSSVSSTNRKAKHHGHGDFSDKVTKTIHPHALQRVAQAPVLVAGHVSGKKESPSFTAGSKKGQSPHSPDARD